MPGFAVEHITMGCSFDSSDEPLGDLRFEANFPGHVTADNQAGNAGDCDVMTRERPNLIPGFQIVISSIL